ncbi:MAG: hypothetical protein HYR91_00905 [Flavobacteriia bacterium]|nr:hypothetical protein [Flavobacteriia bacterium]
MKTLIKFSFIALVATFFSCQKQPVALFSTDKDTYSAGDVIKLTNTTINGKTYKWTISDGQTSVSEHLDYLSNTSQGGETITFTLDAYSKKAKKSDHYSKSIYLDYAKGDVTFWQTQGSGYDITVVSLNGISSNITGEYSSTPNCGDSGCAVFNNIEVGTYSYTATDGTFNWNGTVEVTKDGCTTVNLQ